MPMVRRRSQITYASLLIAALLASCSAPTTETPELATPIPTPDPVDPDGSAGADHDPCLEGTWRMGTADVDLLVATLVPLSGLHVTDGELIMEFDGESFSYRADVLVLRVDLGTDTYLEADGRFGMSGTYTTGDGLVYLNSLGADQQILTWTAYKDGEVVTLPGDGPSFSLPVPGPAPYRCSPDTLEVDTRGALPVTVTMFFSRSG